MVTFTGASAISGTSGIGTSDSWSLVVIPDTQRLAANNSTAYNALTQWIVDNKDTEDIRMVMHVGDLVNLGSSDAQWNVAQTAMNQLHAGDVPFLMAAGNHDFDDDAKGGTYQRAVTKWDARFPNSDWTSYDWYVSGYNSQTQNQAATLTILGIKYLFLTIEIFPRAAVITWANTQITNENPDKIIVITHMMVDQNGNHEPDVVAGSDVPSTYSICDYRTDADCKSGEELYADFISQHDNIILVVNGHDLENGQSEGVAARTDTVNGNVINQHLANYQNISTNSYADSAYIRKYTFSSDGTTCDVTTYNPVQDTSKTDSDNQFTISV